MWESNSWPSVSMKDENIVTKRNLYKYNIVVLDGGDEIVIICHIFTMLRCVVIFMGTLFGLLLTIYIHIHPRSSRR